MSRVRGWLTIPLDNERMQGMAESDEDEHVDDFLHGRRLRIGIISAGDMTCKCSPREDEPRTCRCGCIPTVRHSPFHTTVP